MTQIVKIKEREMAMWAGVVRDIKDMRAKGLTLARIGEKLGVSRQQVWNLLNEKGDLA